MESYLSFADLLHRTSNPVIIIFLPIFLATTFLEMLVLLIWRKSYPWRNAGVSLLVAFGHFIAQAATHGLIFGVIAAGVYKLRVATIPVSRHDWLGIVVLFLLTDLAFYVEHRCSHRIRFLWASHSVHHSSERMLATTAYRLAWTPVLSGVFLFYLPLVWVGYDPVWVYGMVSGSLVYQFFVHTELVPHIGGLEWVLNTPSAHRVHHASNPEYIDKNYGGVLLIWDRLFGTYQAERPDIPIRYGLIHPRSSPSNPFVIAYEELWQMLTTVFRAGSARRGWASLWGPP